MAGGPVGWISAMPEDVHCFPYLFVGAGVVSASEWMRGVTDATTLDADDGWILTFEMPQVLPSGTAKLRILSRAAATTGVLRVNPKWKSVAVGEDPSTGALNAEGVQSITWGAGDSDEYKETIITLDADTVVADEMVLMLVAFENASTTLAVVSGHHFSIIWE